MTPPHKRQLFFVASAAVFVVFALIYAPVVHAWQHRWPPYATSIGERPAMAVQVDMTAVMRWAPAIYRPLLRLHAYCLGWFDAPIADGWSDDSMQFARYLSSGIPAR